MGKKLVIAGLTLFLWASVAAAEIIHLKNGKSIRAKILEKNGQQIKVDIGGVKITYYWDEIDHIEGSENQMPPATAAPLEVPQGTPQKAPAVLSGIPTGQGANSLAPNPDKKALILALIEESGTKDTMAKMFDQIVAQAPSQEAASLKKMLDINEITSRLVPIYDKYFTESQLQELIGFYRSQTGRRLIEVMPMIMEDSMQATMLYFQEKMPARQESTGSATPQP